MKVIFLDFDGVINYQGLFETWDRTVDGPHVISREALKLLNKLVQRTGAKIVLSTMWRHAQPLGELIELLAAFGLADADEVVIDCTPIIEGGFQIAPGIVVGASRGDEIRAWMKHYKVQPAQVVVLDDDTELGDLLPRHVRTYFSEGLKPSHIEEAVALLS